MADWINRYGMRFAYGTSDIKIEMEMVRHGGRWKRKDGTLVGEGIFFHFKHFQELLWPQKVWHRWNEMETKCYLEYRTIAEIGPASCVSGETRIPNPITGEQPTIKSLAESGICPIVSTLLGPVLSGVPFVKGVADLFDVELEDGSHFRATAFHRVLTEHGFQPICALLPGECVLAPLWSISDTDQSARILGDRNSHETIQDWKSDYAASSCSDDARPHPAPKFCQGVFPLPADAPRYMAYASCDSDGQDNKRAHIHPCPPFGHLSNLDAGTLGDYRETRYDLQYCPRIPLHGDELFPPDFRSQSANNPAEPTSIPASISDNIGPNVCLSLTYNPRMVHPVAVASIKFAGAGFFYDLQVPDANHYFAEGAIHHNSGKTNSAATNVMADWFINPESTTCLFCSTTRDRLEDRVWGEVKKYFRLAKQMAPWLPGYLIEGRQRILLDSRNESEEGRDFRNGLIGVPCKRGAEYVGLGDFVGIKNKRVRLVGDELQLLPAVFVDAISNLDKNPDLKVIGLGNPKDTTDALGRLAEPSAEMGGWDGGIDQAPGTKTWPVRRHNGICIQLPGSDSPNLDGKLGIPLITQEQIDRDVSFYGTDSLWYTMFNEGRMPRGQGSRRVLTRDMCVKFHAMEPPNWLDSNRTRIAFLDAAYRGVGGDRCVFGELQFGEEVPPKETPLNLSAIITQQGPLQKRNQIIALIETRVVPIKTGIGDLPEDQIVAFVMNQCVARNIPPSNFFFDSGMRTSLVSAFSRLWSTDVMSIDCGGVPSERYVSSDIPVMCKDYYSKKITEIWYTVRMVVESGQMRGMTEDVIGEFAAREWTVIGQNKIEVEPKDKMKLKTGRSPDLADAFAIGVHGAIQRGFLVKRVGAEFRRRAGKDWRTSLKKQAERFWGSGKLNHRAHA